MVKVKNINGTTGRIPKGYSSWEDFWQSKKGKEFSDCSCKGCTDEAKVGAHVKKVDSIDNKWYIVPLCKGCNSKSISFEVREDDLVPVID